MVSTTMTLQEAEAAASTLSNAAVSQICARLSQMDTTTVPAAMYSNTARPSAEQIETHLKQLLHRDVPVFLERHGSLLTDGELQHFQGLRSDYEVNHYLCIIERSRAAAASGRDTTTKNRRLAYMQQLLGRGDYFSMESMRDRAPLLYEQYIGQHEQQARRPFGQSFLSDVLEENDEAEWRNRLAAERDVYEMQESEEEESEDDEGDQQQEQQPAGQGDAHTASMDADDGTDDADAGGADAMAVDPAGSTAACSREVTGSETTANQAGSTGALNAPGSSDHQQQPAGGAGPSSSAHDQAGPSSSGASGAAAAGTSQQQVGQGGSRAISMADRVQLEQEFITEMKERFLMGQDGKHVDYAAIDSNAELDDHWLEQRARDEEEAYFDD